MSQARTLDPWRWLGIPLLQAIGVTILFAIPIQLWGLQLPQPVFPMPVMFAWAVIRPSLLAPAGILIMGLFLDLFWGGPLGAWPLCLLLGYGLLLAARSIMAGQSRAILWGWYGVVTALALATGYLITMMQAKSIPSLVSVGWTFLSTVILFPFSYRLIDLFEDADVRFR